MSLHYPTSTSLIKDMLTDRMNEVQDARILYAKLKLIQDTSSRSSEYEPLLDSILHNSENIKEEIKEIRNGNYAGKLPDRTV